VLANPTFVQRRSSGVANRSRDDETTDMGRSISGIASALACACALAFAPTSAAQLIAPRSARAFRDSIGVNTHVSYYNTSYGDWSRIVSSLEELGVKHLRDGLFANASAQWHDWNARYDADIQLAAQHGMRFDFLMGRPGYVGGTLNELVGALHGQARGAVEAVEDPNEFDYSGGTPAWEGPLAGYDRRLYELIKSNRSLRSLPVIGPSFALGGSPRSIGDQHHWLDIGNIHPYTGGQSPTIAHTLSELSRAAVTAGSKPVWATEAGFTNALHEPSSTTVQPPVSETAGAVYELRTLLEHFKSGIGRTYLYELIDTEPDAAAADPEQHYGLLRSDFSPKPAFTALRNLLGFVGQGIPPRGLRALRLDVTGDATHVRQLVLERDDGTYVIVLWSLDSVWSTEARRPLAPDPHGITVTLPAGSSAQIADPVTGASARSLPLLDGRARLVLRSDPVILLVRAPSAQQLAHRRSPVHTAAGRDVLRSVRRHR
jgi:hypothetical protein